MNRNTWIIIILAVIVITGLIWMFNRGPSEPPLRAPEIPTTSEDIGLEKLFSAGHCTMYAYTDQGVRHNAGLCDSYGSLSVD